MTEIHLLGPWWLARLVYGWRICRRCDTCNSLIYPITGCRCVTAFVAKLGSIRTGRFRSDQPNVVDVPKSKNE